MNLKLIVVGVVAVATLTSCSADTVRGSGRAATPAAARSSARSVAAGRVAPRPVTTPRPSASGGAPVHAALLQSDGATYGVGMPVVMRFTRAVTDAREFERAVQVRVNGAPATGAWYWERSGATGYAVEAHYRLRSYWPAHATITLGAPIQGLSAGAGLRFDDSLTLSMRTGAAHVSTVDASATHPTMTVTSDGKVVGTLSVSLGKASTPTYRGTKIVEEFDRYQDMGGTSVPWSVRLTNSGEFAHAAPWNSQIGRANLSHGCTNLSMADAEWFFHFSRLGDVVRYPNATGPTMPVWDGIGDWNVTWAQWRAGGLLAGRG